MKFKNIILKMLNRKILLCCIKLFQSCPTLCDPMNCIAFQAPLAVGLSRQEHQTELPFPLLGDLPDPRTELESPLSPVGRQILYR